MATSQPSSTVLYIVYKQTFNARSYFYVVGDPALIAQYQASLPKAFVEDRGPHKGVAVYCDPSTHASLFKTAMLRPVRKKDGSVGWFLDDREYKAMEEMALKATVKFQFEYWMDKAVAIAKEGVEIPEEYLAQLTPVAPPVTTPPVAEPVAPPDATVDAEAFNPSPIDGE